MRDKHSQDRLCSTQQTNSYKEPRILFASQQPTASNWDWACGGATVNWTATDLSAGRVTTHYAALQNTEASFWHTDSWPDAHTLLIFHLMFSWMTISSFRTIEIFVLICVFVFGRNSHDCFHDSFPISQEIEIKAKYFRAYLFES